LVSTAPTPSNVMTIVREPPQACRAVLAYKTRVPRVTGNGC
jgi:hypothetical protein